jgi:hypothetical protein
MKRISTLLIVGAVMVSILGNQRTEAQFLNYQHDSGWYLGGNIGGMYQDPKRAEVAPAGGIGGGFVIGKEWKREKRFFSFGLQFRYLTGITYGKSIEKDTSAISLSSNNAINGTFNSSIVYDSTSGYFHNYRNNFYDYSLEGVLTLNGLRNKTGIILSVFGGGAIQQYRVKTDLLDFTKSTYQSDYANLPNLTNRGELNFIRDGEYESWADGNNGWKARFMPSLGVLLGYQVSPYFSIGLQHRISFTGTDFYDGNQYMPNATTTNDLNDWLHYTNLTMRWHIKGKASGNVNNNNNIDTYTHTHTTTNPTPTPPAIPKPRVEFIDPYSNPHTTTSSTFLIQANVFNVSSHSNVTFKQNGVSNMNFTFDPNTSAFTANVILKPGENVFEIRGTNQAGSAYGSRIIVYEQPQVTLFPPVVTISNPPYSPYVVNNQSFNVAASVFNITNASQIEFRVNGVRNYNFTYDTYSKAFSSNISLNPGTNNIQITATNTAGTDSKSAVIVYEQPAVSIPMPPVVTILNPSLNPTTVSTPAFALTASVTNVTGSSNISVKINGNPVSTFSYNPTTDILNLGTNLVQGSNVFEIYAFNNDGSDYASTTVIYVIPNTVLPPVVTITNPLMNPTTVYVPTTTVQGQVLNVSGSNQITVKVNGVATSNFSYSSSSKLVTINAALNIGANLFEIIGTNSAGSAQASTTVIYQPQNLEQPPVVTYLNPAVNPLQVSTSTFPVTATVLNVNASTQITVKVNGSNITGFGFNVATKVVSFNANLVQGSNTVTITGTNTAGTDTESTIIIYQPVQAVLPPTVVITTPAADPFTTSVSQINISAQVTNVSLASGVQVLVNGMNFANFTFNPTTGLVNFTPGLQQGNNLIQVTAQNTAGSASDATNIIYQPIQQCDKPVISFVQPNVPVLNHINASNVYTVIATVTNITSAQNVVARVNGVQQSNVIYNAANQQISLQATLANSGNVIEITATNSCGASTNSCTILYGTVTPPCNKPAISVTAPTVTPLVTYATTETVQALITEITSANQIVFKHDGMPKSNYTYDAATHQLNGTVNLQMGQNKIEIIATNTCGSTNTFVYIERRVCNNPVLTISAPANNSTSTNGSATISGSVTGISTQSDITVTLNGQPVSFLLKNGAISSVQPLQNGQNTFVVTATNECGSTVETIVVNYTACNQPTVTITNPANSAGTSTGAAFNLTAVAQNIPAASGIVVTLNGTVVSSTYNAGTGAISANLNLQPGNNSIQVTATNSCGSVSANATVEMLCPEPTLVLTNPASGSAQTSNGTFSVTATAAGATSVSVTVNGQNTNATLNPATGVVTVNATLQTGNNTITITATNACGSISQNVTVSKDCPLPVIAAPASTNGTVTTSTTTINGTVQNATSVSATVNGTAVSAGFNAQNGTFSFVANLQTGANAIVIIATGDCGSVTSDVNVNMSCPAAVLVVSSPSGNAGTTSSSSYSVSGTCQNCTGIQATVNGAPISASLNGNAFTLNASLQNGANTVVIDATGDCGTATQSVTITKTCVQPTLSFSSPSTSGILVSNPAFTINANVSGATNVSLMVNGSAVNANFNASNGAVSANVTLVAGTNTIVLTATNDCGTVSETTGVKYQCPQPTITLTEPSTNNYIAPAATMNLSGNASNATGIQVTLNGQSVPATFSASSGSFITQLSLNSGTNIIVIAATGNCGATSETITADYTPATNSNINVNCLPTVTASFISTNKAVTVSSSHAIDAVKLIFHDNMSEMVTNLGSNTANLIGTGLNINKCITDVYVVSGCNTDGDPNGEHFHNNNWTGTCGDGKTNANNTGGIVGGGTTDTTGTGTTGNGNGNTNGNNGHGNNEDGVDSSNPGQGQGGSNGTNDPSGNVDDEGANGNQDSSNGNSGNTNGGQNSNGNNNGNNNGNGNHSMDPTITNPNNTQADQERIKAEEEARRKAAEEAAKQEAARKAAEEEARKKAAEEAAKQEAARKAAEEEARRKAAEEAAKQEAARKAAEEVAAAKVREQYNSMIQAGDQAFANRDFGTAKSKYNEALRLMPNEHYPKTQIVKCDTELRNAASGAEEEARRKAAEEAAKRQAEEEARRKAAEEAAKRQTEEEARRKAAEEAAKRQAEESARQRAAEEAAKRQAEEAARQRAAEEAAKRQAEEAARQKAIQDAARQKAAAEAAAKKKAEEEAARKKAEEEAARKKAEEEKKTPEGGGGLKPVGGGGRIQPKTTNPSGGGGK